MTRTKTILTTALATLALTLTACSTMGLYHPSRYTGDSGFSDQELMEGRYRVMFHGSPNTSRAQVEDYLLLRAAELTLEQGQAGFKMTERETEVDREIRTLVRSPFYGRHSHGVLTEPWGFPYYAYGYDWAYPTRYSVYETREYTAAAYIDLLSAAELSRTPGAFDARDVMDTIGPVSCYKKEPHDETKCPLAHAHD